MSRRADGDAQVDGEHEAQGVTLRDPRALAEPHRHEDRDDERPSADELPGAVGATSSVEACVVVQELIVVARVANRTLDAGFARRTIRVGIAIVTELSPSAPTNGNEPDEDERERQRQRDRRGFDVHTNSFHWRGDARAEAVRSRTADVAARVVRELARLVRLHARQGVVERIPGRGADGRRTPHPAE